MTRGTDEAARMSERFVKGFGTSDDACGIHGCAVVSHIRRMSLVVAYCYPRRTYMLCCQQRGLGSRMLSHHAPSAERLRKLWRRWKGTSYEPRIDLIRT